MRSHRVPRSRQSDVGSFRRAYAGRQADAGRHPSDHSGLTAVPTVQARHGSGPNAADWIGTARPKVWCHFLRWLLIAVEASAAFLLVAGRLVVGASVLGRHFLAAPLVWSDDVARALLLAVTFLGAAAAL